MPTTFQVPNRRGASSLPRIAFVSWWLLRQTMTTDSQEVLKSLNFTSNKHLTAKSIDAVQTITGVSLNATQLANRLVGPGLTLISAAVVVGNKAQFGTFTDGEATIGMSSGIVLSTGNVIDVKGSCREVVRCKMRNVALILKIVGFRPESISKSNKQIQWGGIRTTTSLRRT
jgi:hypothetical protein